MDELVFEQLLKLQVRPVILNLDIQIDLINQHSQPASQSVCQSVSSSFNGSTRHPKIGIKICVIPASHVQLKRSISFLKKGFAPINKNPFYPITSSITTTSVSFNFLLLLPPPSRLISHLTSPHPTLLSTSSSAVLGLRSP